MVTTAVILAAGLGSRLRPLTRDKPKGMVTAAGLPILEHQLIAYERAGFDKVYVVGGYRVEAIEAWLATRPGDLDVHLIENPIFDVTNNMYSLFLVRDHLRGQPFCLSNGDVVFDTRILSELTSAPAQRSYLTVDTSVFHEESMKVVIDADENPCGLSKTYAEAESFAVSTDIYRFSADGSQRLFAAIAEFVVTRRERTLWTEVAIDEILKTAGHDFGYVDISGSPWVEVDNLDDLAQADLLFNDSRARIAAAKAFVFDIDGTLAVDGTVVPGAVEAVNSMRATAAVFFCSNNSSRSRGEYRDLLESIGIPCRVDDVVSSTGATISYLRNRGIASIYLIGTPSLQRELEAAGSDCTAESVDMIVVGFDRTLSYDKIAQASRLIAAGTPYILTHRDPACPTPDGPIPDAGAIGALLKAATGVDPVAVLGKPSPSMLQPVLDECGLQPEEIVMIGDRLTTDIRMAETLGCLSVLVLTGITSRDDVEGSALQPTMLANTVADLATLLPATAQVTL